LKGFDNLSGTTSSIDNDSGNKLKDMNLENAIDAGQYANPFIFNWSARQGIYKVILYAKSATKSIADWKVMKL
jgi:hypothetical protein